MVELAELDQLKAQCRVDSDDEDDVLQHYLDSAAEYVLGFVPELADSPPQPVPDTVNQAVLLIAASWYAQREDSLPDQQKDIPMSAQQLLNQVRTWSFG
jgi:uncharacterized phage protein (predicted DNA packaging)